MSLSDTHLPYKYVVLFGKEGRIHIHEWEFLRWTNCYKGKPNFVNRCAIIPREAWKDGKSLSC